MQNPDISYRDSLAEDYSGDREAYSLILANPPFTGSLDFESTAKNLLEIVKTKKTELLFHGPVPAAPQARRQSGGDCA